MAIWNRGHWSKLRSLWSLCRKRDFLFSFLCSAPQRKCSKINWKSLLKKMIFPPFLVCQHNYGPLIISNIYFQLNRFRKQGEGYSAVHLQFSKIIDQWFLALERRFGERENTWKFRPCDHMHAVCMWSHHMHTMVTHPKVIDTVWSIFESEFYWQSATKRHAKLTRKVTKKQTADKSRLKQIWPR